MAPIHWPWIRHRAAGAFQVIRTPRGRAVLEAYHWPRARMARSLMRLDEPLVIARERRRFSFPRHGERPIGPHTGWLVDGRCINRIGSQEAASDPFTSRAAVPILGIPFFLLALHPSPLSPPPLPSSWSKVDPLEVRWPPDRARVVERPLPPPPRGRRPIPGAISMFGYGWAKVVERHGLARKLVEAWEDLATARATAASWKEKAVLARALRVELDRCYAGECSLLLPRSSAGALS